MRHDHHTIHKASISAYPVEMMEVETVVVVAARSLSSLLYLQQTTRHPGPTEMIMSTKALKKESSEGRGGMSELIGLSLKPGAGLYLNTRSYHDSCSLLPSYVLGIEQRVSYSRKNVALCVENVTYLEVTPKCNRTPNATLTLISSNFENLYNYNNKSEIYYFDLKLTVIVCSFRNPILE